MESQANAPNPSEVIPPWEPKIVLSVGAAGVALSGLSALTALLTGAVDLSAGVISPIRVILGALGVFVAGVAIWLRPGLTGAWLCGAGACFLAYFGFPTEWDSAWKVAVVFGTASLFAAALLQVPMQWRLAAASVVILVHFGGILTAVTGPEPQPFLSGQSWVRVYRPYLQFMYLNNAYHFYSPDPGPAIQIWACVYYDTDDKDKRCAWYKFPQRPEQVKDPLAMTYYRRLSLTEQVNPATANPSPIDMEDIQQRRNLRPDIPESTNIGQVMPYRPPSFEIRTRLVPNYVRHIARIMQARQPDTPIKTIKFYRIEHRIVPPVEFARGMDPYDPTTYLPYYFGEYDTEGNLLNPRDPLLHWLIPRIRPQGTFGSRPGEEAPLRDYLAEHAGCDPDRGGTR